MRTPTPISRALLGLAPGLLIGLLACLAGCGEGGSVRVLPSAGADAAVLTVVDPQDPATPDEIEMGRIPYGEKGHHTLRLRNDSGAPLTIRNVRPGCSCTTPELSYVDPASGQTVRGNSRSRDAVITLPPGVVADMLLTVDSTLSPVKNQHKLIVVRVTTDSPVQPYITFNLRVFVESHFLPSPAVLDLRQVPLNGGGSGVLGLAADNPDGHILTGVQRAPLEVLCELTRNDLNGAALWDLSVRLLPPLTLGFHEYEVLLSTSGPDGQGEGPPFLVKVRATGVEDIALEPAVLMLDHLEPGDRSPSQARVISRLGGQVLGLTSARVEGDLADKLQVEIAPLNPDGEGRSALWELRLLAVADMGGPSNSSRLVVETDEPQAPRLETRIVYRP